MNRITAIGIVNRTLAADDLVVSVNGDISREHFSFGDRPGNFYMLGSMGLAASIGLGLALHLPRRRVIVLDGDGNLLMGLGNLAMVGAVRPVNFYHVLIDNGVYGTTGDQPTVSAHTDFAGMARAAGYRSAEICDREDTLDGLYREMTARPGPGFIHVRVSRDKTEKCPRIPYSAREIKERLAAFAGVR